ncbi:uncharacterized protein LOC133840206 [Drosophila sulfurigaster albostrigata]|uniref:uncharacterized protein LOC133840206 n=1 Tax=Drosophila sulfurigaster albostrigata TaxID=89887 RepID=UPI002D219BB7|nr:uncharacterized protein LOC133840206 [Drosophila sulfurigaster albostrigata]
MFANKAPKSNNLVTNTQQKFRAQLKFNEKSFRNGGFESASGLLRKSGSQLKQTKLSLCQQDNKLIFSGFVEEPSKAKSKLEFGDEPNVKVKAEPATALSTAPMSKPGRNLLSLIGRVDFCIKMQRTQLNLNAIWNVYGNLLRIIEGKRGERTLLLRNDDKGPILQSIFYDFAGELESLSNGSYVHVVGRFTGENRLNTFSVTQVSIAEWQLNFSRIENLTSYLLMQNIIHK